MAELTFMGACKVGFVNAGCATLEHAAAAVRHGGATAAAIIKVVLTSDAIDEAGFEGSDPFAAQLSLRRVRADAKS